MNVLDVVLAVLALFALSAGLRLGLLARVSTWIGLLAGLAASTLAVPAVLGRVQTPGAGTRLLLGLAVLVVTVTVGSTVGGAIGQRLRSAVADTVLGGPDRLAGGLAGLAGLVACTWLVAPAAYSASKAGLLGLTRSVALDCAERGVPIRANMVHPGAIRTPMYDRYTYPGADTPENIETSFAATHPMNRIGEPEEVARAVVWLASDEASFTTGCDITVDGGGSIRS